MAVTNAVEMACISPYYSQVKGEWVPFPCGRCPPCKKRRVDGWVFRLKQEDRRSTSAHFVTLTYETDFVPISPNGFLTLDKKAFPLFMKRLRKLCPDSRLKYYACGEYGSKNHRPHYHAIIFNCPSDGLFFDAWQLAGRHIGTVHVGDVSGDSIAYTMKYIDKSTFKSRHSRDDRVPEFALMSKGLGENYVSDHVIDYHKADLNRNFLSLDGGHKIAMPRYYRSRIFDDDEMSVQRGIIDMAVGEANSKNYADYLRLYAGSDFSYDQYVQSQRMGIVSAFYSNQQNRDL